MEHLVPPQHPKANPLTRVGARPRPAHGKSGSDGNSKAAGTRANPSSCPRTEIPAGSPADWSTLITERQETVEKLSSRLVETHKFWSDLAVGHPRDAVELDYAVKHNKEDKEQNAETMQP